MWVVLWVEFTPSNIQIRVTPHHVRRPSYWSNVFQRVMDLLGQTDSCILWTLLLRPQGPSSSPRWQLMVECSIHNRTPLLLHHIPLSLSVLSYLAIKMIIIFWHSQLTGLWGLWFPLGRSPRWRGRGASSLLWGRLLHHGDFHVLQK